MFHGITSSDSMFSVRQTEYLGGFRGAPTLPGGLTRRHPIPSQPSDRPACPSEGNRATVGDQVDATDM